MREGKGRRSPPYLEDTTSVPAAKSPSLWLRFETRMATPAGIPPKNSELASKPPDERPDEDAPPAAAAAAGVDDY